MKKETPASGIRRASIPLLTAAGMLLFAGTKADAAANVPDVEFVLPESSQVETNEGTVQLAWKVEGEPIGNTQFNFEIERATDAAFASAQRYYEGSENGTFISGLPAGDFFFRARAVAADGSTGAWSAPPVHVTVRYAPPVLVKTLMLVGAFVFVATLVVVVRGHGRAGRSALVSPGAGA